LATVTVQTIPDLGETREFLAMADETDFASGSDQTCRADADS
jgi:hypothetical protein